MSLTSPMGHDAVTSSGREGVASLDSKGQESQPTWDDFSRDFKNLVKKMLALQDAEKKKSDAMEETESQLALAILKNEAAHQSMRNMKQLLASKNRELACMQMELKQRDEKHDKQLQLKEEIIAGLGREIDDYKSMIRAMKGAFDVATQKFSSSSEGERQIVRSGETGGLQMDDIPQGTRCEKAHDSKSSNNSANTPSNTKVQNLNSETEECARESDGVAEKSAVVTYAVETIIPPAKGRKTADSARPFQCVACGAAYCRAEELARHQARECGYLLAAGSPRQEQKEKEDEQFIAGNKEKNTPSHQERSTKCTPGKTNASDVIEGVIFVDSDESNDAHDESMNNPDYSPQETTGREKCNGKDEQLYCNNCGDKFRSMCTLNFHLKHDCGKEKAACKRCGILLKPSTLKKHTDRNDCIAKDELWCKYCHLISQDGKRFKMHQRLCKEKKNNNPVSLKRMKINGRKKI